MIILFTVLVFPSFGITQSSANAGPFFEVYRVHPYLSITQEAINEVHTLSELNPHFKASWIKDYISVKVLTIHDGKTRTSTGKSETLTREQKNNLLNADVDQEVSVKVLYIPENNLKQNDPKEMDFTFVFIPENEANFPKGKGPLKNYLKKTAIDKIEPGVFVGYNLAAVKFTLNKEGEIFNVHLFESSTDKKTDELLLKAIQNMPCWEPAEYANGQETNQEFVLTVGNMENCMVNLLNIRQD
ncbi:MAG: energy transducer TonB [Bacteroidetes bacterium]|nr:MAG: energy transducer TonB [Bacteroidota bacterium]